MTVGEREEWMQEITLEADARAVQTKEEEVEISKEVEDFLECSR